MTNFIFRHVSKENKRMVCDCTLTKEETAREEKGCGEDCLNRLLLIEWSVSVFFLLLFHFLNLYNRIFY